MRGCSSIREKYVYNFHKKQLTNLCKWEKVCLRCISNCAPRFFAIDIKIQRRYNIYITETNVTVRKRRIKMQHKNAEYFKRIIAFIDDYAVNNG